MRAKVLMLELGNTQVQEMAVKHRCDCGAGHYLKKSTISLRNVLVLRGDVIQSNTKWSSSQICRA